MMQNCFTSQLDAATRANINARCGWITVFFMTLMLVFLGVIKEGSIFLSTKWLNDYWHVISFGGGVAIVGCFLGAIFWAMRGAKSLDELITRVDEKTSIIRMGLKSHEMDSVTLAIEWCQLLLVHHQNEVKVNRWLMIWPWANPFIFK